MALLPRPGERAAPILSAVLLTAAFPPVGLHPLVFVALVPAAIWLRSLPSGEAGARAAARGGLLLGVVHFGLLLHWIVPALLPLTPLAPFAYLTTVLLLGALVAGVLRLAHALSQGRFPGPTLALALAWTGGEWLRGAVGELAFPWAGLGVALAPAPALAGAAELGGAIGLTFWIVSVNGALAAWLDGAPWRRLAAGWGLGKRPAPAESSRSLGVPPPDERWFRARWAVLLLAAPAVFGLIRDRTLESREVGTVAAVRSELERADVLDPAVRIRDGLRALRLGTAELSGVAEAAGPGGAGVFSAGEATRPGGAGAFSAGEATRPGSAEGTLRLVVWPEILLPVVLGGGGSTDRLLSGFAAEVGAPFLVGGYVVVEGPRGPARGNGLVLLSPGDGADAFRYAKRRLVPGVEGVPFAAVLGRLPGASVDGGLVRGSGALVGTAGGLSFGPLICYESAFSAAARAARRAGAQILVNATNDGWFGGTGAAGMAGRAQHAPHLVLRSLESRMGAVRSAQSGETFFVDPRGRVHDRVWSEGFGVTTAAVRTTDVMTLHSRAGDWAGWGSGIVLLALLLLPRLSPAGGGATGRGAVPPPPSDGPA